MAEILNSREKSNLNNYAEHSYEKTLEKCPDKNAKLIFDVTFYMKEEISPDKVSQASTRTLNVETMPISGTQPNFKKKKKDESIEEKKDMSRKKS